jgi:lipoyl(octanoyl) transferase
MSITARIIDDTAHDAAFNMAADLYLLAQSEDRPELSVRLYTWEKPSITLGYGQKAAETLDRAAVYRDGVEWIRRPTGGRAVLHDGDITYSVVFSSSIAEMGKTLSETYRIISDSLLAGLAAAGIDCLPHDSGLNVGMSRSSVKLPCFLSPNRAEIMSGARKLVGSAQKRSAKAVLQHGSIPLTDHYRMLPQYLDISDEERILQKRLLERKSVCIEEIRKDISEKQLRHCLLQGFCETLPFPATREGWSESEQKEIFNLSQKTEFVRKWQERDS